MTSPIAFRLSCVLAAMLPYSIPAPALQSAPQSQAVPPLVHRFLSRIDERVTSYRALRRLEAHNNRYKKHGWLEVWTTLDPENGFTYKVVGEGGSTYVREKVLRKALEREREAHLKSESQSAAIDPANYNFSGSLAAEQGVVGVGLKPKRKEPLLVAGTVYFTEEDADLVRIEGDLVKKPSFWTRSVHVVRRYGRIGNVRVPLAFESTAQIVLAGESSFLMRYEYASINGRDVGNPVPTSPVTGDR
jgi:hypothetical protein